LTQMLWNLSAGMKVLRAGKIVIMGTSRMVIHTVPMVRQTSVLYVRLIVKKLQEQIYTVAMERYRGPLAQDMNNCEKIMGITDEECDPGDDPACISDCSGVNEGKRIYVNSVAGELTMERVGSMPIQIFREPLMMLKNPLVTGLPQKLRSGLQEGHINLLLRQVIML